MRGLLRRWARSVLTAELDELTTLRSEHRRLLGDYQQATTRVRELSAARRYAEARLRQVEDSERHQRAAASGAALLRLEHELRRRWDRLTEALEAPDRVLADGTRVCGRVALHSRHEARRLAERLRRQADYPVPLEPYPCYVCPPHPLVGRVQHLRRAASTVVSEPDAGPDTVEPTSAALPDDVRERLVTQLRHDNGPSTWTPFVSGGTVIVPSVGPIVDDGTNDERPYGAADD